MVPLATTLRRLFLAVVQFHLRLRNWCWHSLLPSWAPLTISCKTSGSLRHISALRPLCTRRWLWRHKRIGSITAWPTLALPTHTYTHTNQFFITPTHLKLLMLCNSSRFFYQNITIIPYSQSFRNVITNSCNKKPDNLSAGRIFKEPRWQHSFNWLICVEHSAGHFLSSISIVP